MFCYHCGKKLPEGAEFCGACGKEVKGSGAQKPVTEAPGVTPPDFRRDFPGEQINIAMTVDEILMEERESKKTLRNPAPDGSAQPDNPRPPIQGAEAFQARDEAPRMPVKRPEIQDTGREDAMPDMPGETESVCDEVPGMKKKKTLRTALWIIVAALFFAAEIAIWFFAELKVGTGSLFKYAVMASVFVISAALFIIAGIVCGEEDETRECELRRDDDVI